MRQLTPRRRSSRAFPTSPSLTPTLGAGVAAAAAAGPAAGCASRACTCSGPGCVGQVYTVGVNNGLSVA
eukprot:50622-Chlamydomonas_euryale.AAC.1